MKALDFAGEMIAPSPAMEARRLTIQRAFDTMQRKHGCACPLVWDDVVSLCALMFLQGQGEQLVTTGADVRAQFDSIHRGRRP